MSKNNKSPSADYMINKFFKHCHIDCIHIIVDFFNIVLYTGLVPTEWCLGIIIDILSVYNPFSDRVGLPLHNTPFPGVLMKSIGAAFFDRMPFLTSTTCVGCNIK